MEPNETALISGQIVAEFEDDASQFLAGEPEYLRAPETTAGGPVPAAVPLTNGVPQAGHERPK